MVMGALTLTVNGTDKVIANIGSLSLAIKDLRPAFKVARLLIMESVNRNFMEGGRPKWLPLSPLTILRRTKGKGTGSAEPLRDTGLLMLSIGNPGSKGIDVLTEDTLRVGTNVPYAAAQNFGHKQIPARPFMVLQPEDEDKIVQAIREHIEKAVP
jgi:phage gpG-like protein